MTKKPLTLQPQAKVTKARAAEASDDTAVAAAEGPSKIKWPTVLRYRLQVDRQTKSTYDTLEKAKAAGIRIKKSFPQVRVAIYDVQEGMDTVIELAT